eukprot:220939-Pyramimonas_sp.AAC.1
MIRGSIRISRLGQTTFQCTLSSRLYTTALPQTAGTLFQEKSSVAAPDARRIRRDLWQEDNAGAALRPFSLDLPSESSTPPGSVLYVQSETCFTSDATTNSHPTPTGIPEDIRARIFEDLEKQDYAIWDNVL